MKRSVISEAGFEKIFWFRKRGIPYPKSTAGEASYFVLFFFFLSFLNVSMARKSFTDRMGNRRTDFASQTKNRLIHWVRIRFGFVPSLPRPREKISWAVTVHFYCLCKNKNLLTCEGWNRTFLFRFRIRIVRPWRKFKNAGKEGGGRVQLWIFFLVYVSAINPSSRSIILLVGNGVKPAMPIDVKRLFKSPQNLFPSPPRNSN